MIPYDIEFDPPAPVIAVILSNSVRARPKVTVRAMIDTGSDITAVPQTVRSKLRLQPFGRLLLEGVQGQRTQVFTYEVRLAYEIYPAQELEVIVTSLPFVVLGRDWLRSYYLALNGPESTFELGATPLG